jgi:hypothetical protein
VGVARQHSDVVAALRVVTIVGYVTLIIVGALALYGFKTVLGGRPLIQGAAIGA